MKTSKEDLQVAIAFHDTKIKEKYAEIKASNQEIITDGIVDIKAYTEKSSVRILWLLKEPYCDKNDGGGGWSMTEGLQQRADGKKTDSQATWHPIIYVTYGILNNFMKYDDMPNRHQKINVCNI